MNDGEDDSNGKDRAKHASRCKNEEKMDQSHQDSEAARQRKEREERAKAREDMLKRLKEKKALELLERDAKRHKSNMNEK